MDRKTIIRELAFLVMLSEISSKYILEARKNSKEFPEDFDVAKGILFLNKAIHAQIENLRRDPEDYFKIYED